MMNSEQVMDKVRKLLELAASPNENEARLAMNRAQELIQKYNLDIFEAQNATECKVDSFIYKPPVNCKGGSGLINQLPWIANTVGRIFGCQVLVAHNGAEVIIYGFPTNLKLVSYALDSLIAQGSIDYKAGYRKYKTITFSETFWLGFAQALKARFDQQVQTANALIVYDPVKAAVDAISKGATFSGFVSTDSVFGMETGTRSGNEAQIRKGIQVGSSGKLLN